MGQAGQTEAMQHGAAVEQMAAERYLLNELTLDERDAFEAHVFDCPECALDLRAAAAFVDEAQMQLPALVAADAAVRAPRSVQPPRRSSFQNFWTSLMRPAFAMPAFAALLLVIGVQNLVTLPRLRSRADTPRLMAWAPTHGATRGAATITVDRAHGVALPIDVSSSSGLPVSYAIYFFKLTDPQGKTVWSGSMSAPASSDGDSQRVLLAVPGTLLHDGAYTVAITGIAQNGERTPLERRVFNLAVAQ